MEYRTRRCENQNILSRLSGQVEQKSMHISPVLKQHTGLRNGGGYDSKTDLSGGQVVNRGASTQDLIQSRWNMTTLSWRAVFEAHSFDFFL